MTSTETKQRAETITRPAPRALSWFSCGAASAVATKLVLADSENVTPVYCVTGAEHPENATFLDACETWLGVPITKIRSADYADTWDLWTRRRYLAGIDGAICTTELKVGPRLLFQRPHDHHVFGYTADAPDVARAKRLVESYPEIKIRTPLIERGLTKAGCISMIERAGLPVPPMYALGFANNNCIPCVKATSPSYWALVRLRFPEQFARMATLSRELGVRLCRISDERRFIDEIPNDWPVSDPVQPSCDFLCAIAESDMEPKAYLGAVPVEDGE